MHPTTYLAFLLAVGLDVVLSRPTHPHMKLHARGLASHGGKRALARREVPQEHSHEIFLTVTNEFLRKNNPDQIQDAVFGLLGNAAASQGQGRITNTDCLQQATADRAFTNAKAAGDIDGQTAALIYRSLERNTGAVGQASVACTAIKAVNPEIAAISQHQDPASANAAQINKNIVLELAFQISSIGGDPLDALDSGTFEPGQIGDPTAKGNSCDDQNDPQGCIFTQNLGVEDATEDEIRAFVSSRGGNVNPVEINPSAGAGTATSSTTAPAAPATSTTSAAAAAATTTTTTTTTTTPAKTSAAAAAPAKGKSAKVDTGSCPDPTIIFADGLDGRKEKSFEPRDKTAFPHGSALGIKVITDFICQQLDVKCKAPASTITVCNQGAAAAQKATGQAAADAFNAAFGL